MYTQNDLNSLENTTNEMITSIKELKKSANCKKFHENYKKLENQICQDTINYLVAFYCVLFGLVACLLIRNLFLCTQKKRQLVLLQTQETLERTLPRVHEDHVLQVNVDDDQVQRRLSDIARL